jgi:DNA-binding MarR family transcriptional regulator
VTPRRPDPATAIEAALSDIRRRQQRGSLQRLATPGEDPRRASLTAAKYRYLDALAAADAVGAGLSIADIAERIGVDQPRASRLTAELARAGLIDRSRDAADQRRQVITLTAAGRAPLEQAAALRRDRVALALRALSAAERQQLAQLLTRFLAAWE